MSLITLSLNAIAGGAIGFAVFTAANEGQLALAVGISGLWLLCMLRVPI